MGRILEPLLWRNQRQTHTSPAQSRNEIDFNMASDEAILILQYEVTIENPITVSGLVAAGLSVEPDVAPSSLTVFASDNDTVALFTWEEEFTTSGEASQFGYASVLFPEPGLLIIDNPSVHLITLGAAVTQGALHRLWYKIVRLTELETAGLIVRRRRQ